MRSADRRLARVFPLALLWPAVVAAALVLSGCATPTAPTVRVVGSLLSPLWTGPPQAAAFAARLNPALTYLYLAEDGHAPVFLALGYIEPSQPPTLVWYSAAQEVLRTQGGRLVGLTEQSASSARLRFDQGIPVWPTATAGPTTYTRSWDFPNRYRFGLPDQVQLHPRGWQQVPPALLRHVRSQLQSSAYAQWQWFEETSTLMPPAWFAVAALAGQQQVVYSYQCLSAERCFHLAPWPLALTPLP